MQARCQQPARQQRPKLCHQLFGMVISTCHIMNGTANNKTRNKWRFKKVSPFLIRQDDILHSAGMNRALVPVTTVGGSYCTAMLLSRYQDDIQLYHETAFISNNTSFAALPSSAVICSCLLVRTGSLWHTL